MIVLENFADVEICALCKYVFLNLKTWTCCTKRIIYFFTPNNNNNTCFNGNFIINQIIVLWNFNRYFVMGDSLMCILYNNAGLYKRDVIRRILTCVYLVQVYNVIVIFKFKLKRKTKDMPSHDCHGINGIRITRYVLYIYFCCKGYDT